MATTFLFPGKYYPISGGIAPTLILPGGTGHPDPAIHGDSVSIEFVSSIHNTGTVDSGSASIRDPNSGLIISSPLPLVTARETYNYVYNDEKTLWEIVSSHKFKTEASLYGRFNFNFSIPTLPAQSAILFDFLGGDSFRFAVAIDTLTANIQFDDPVSLTFDLAGVMEAISNNLEVEIHAGFRATGSGGFFGIDDVFPFQTSRVGDWEWKLSGSAIWTPEIGDTLRLIVSIAAFSTMTANATDVLIVIAGS